MRNKTKIFNVCTALDHPECLLILVFNVTECVSISAFALLIDISIDIGNSVIGLKICEIAALN